MELVRDPTRIPKKMHFKFNTPKKTLRPLDVRNEEDMKTLKRLTQELKNVSVALSNQVREKDRLTGSLLYVSNSDGNVLAQEAETMKQSQIKSRIAVLQLAYPWLRIKSENWESMVDMMRKLNTTYKDLSAEAKTEMVKQKIRPIAIESLEGEVLDPTNPKDLNPRIELIIKLIGDLIANANFGTNMLVTRPEPEVADYFEQMRMLPISEWPTWINDPDNRISLGLSTELNRPIWIVHWSTRLFDVGHALVSGKRLDVDVDFNNNTINVEHIQTNSQVSIPLTKGTYAILNEFAPENLALLYNVRIITRNDVRHMLNASRKMYKTNRIPDNLIEIVNVIDDGYAGYIDPDKNVDGPPGLDYDPDEAHVDEGDLGEGPVDEVVEVASRSKKKKNKRKARYQEEEDDQVPVLRDVPIGEQEDNIINDDDVDEEEDVNTEIPVKYRLAYEYSDQYAKRTAKYGKQPQPRYTFKWSPQNKSSDPVLRGFSSTPSTAGRAAGTVFFEIDTNSDDGYEISFSVNDEPILYVPYSEGFITLLVESDPNVLDSKNISDIDVLRFAELLSEVKSVLGTYLNDKKEWVLDNLAEMKADGSKEAKQFYRELVTEGYTKKKRNITKSSAPNYAKPTASSSAKTKRGEGIIAYKKPADLAERLKVLIGQMAAGNDGKNIKNDIATIADELKDIKAISAKTYKAIYKKINFP